MKSLINKLRQKKSLVNRLFALLIAIVLVSISCSQEIEFEEPPIIVEESQTQDPSQNQSETPKQSTENTNTVPNNSSSDTSSFKEEDKKEESSKKDEENKDDEIKDETQKNDEEVKDEVSKDEPSTQLPTTSNEESNSDNSNDKPNLPPSESLIEKIPDDENEAPPSKEDNKEESSKNDEEVKDDKGETSKDEISDQSPSSSDEESNNQNNTDKPVIPPSNEIIERIPDNEDITPPLQEENKEEDQKPEENNSENQVPVPEDIPSEDNKTDTEDPSSEPDKENKDDLSDSTDNEGITPPSQEDTSEPQKPEDNFSEEQDQEEDKSENQTPVPEVIPSESSKDDNDVTEDITDSEVPPSEPDQENKDDYSDSNDKEDVTPPSKEDSSEEQQKPEINIPDNDNSSDNTEPPKEDISDNDETNEIPVIQYCTVTLYDENEEYQQFSVLKDSILYSTELPVLKYKDKTFNGWRCSESELPINGQITVENDMKLYTLTSTLKYGDLIMADGSFLSLDFTVELIEKLGDYKVVSNNVYLITGSSIVGVICRVNDGELDTLGFGINIKNNDKFRWAETTAPINTVATGFNTEFARGLEVTITDLSDYTGYKGEKLNLTQLKKKIKNEVYDGENLWQYMQKNYNSSLSDYNAHNQAQNYGLNYIDSNSELSNSWYLPTKTELVFVLYTLESKAKQLKKIFGKELLAISNDKLGISMSNLPYKSSDDDACLILYYYKPTVKKESRIEVKALSRTSETSQNVIAVRKF